MSDDLERMLTKLARLAMDEDDEEKDKDIDVFKHMEALQEYNAQTANYPVGTFVVRNKFGKKKYKLPQEGDVGIITDVFGVPTIDSNGHASHGCMGIAISDKVIMTFPIDFRCYQEVKKT